MLGLTKTKDRCDRSVVLRSALVGTCLWFQIRPNFGERYFSERIRLLHDMIVISAGKFCGPYGFGIGRMGGRECVDGAYILCNLELAYSAAPAILIAPFRTQISYWPTRVKLCERTSGSINEKVNLRIIHLFWEKQDSPFCVCFPNNRFSRRIKG